MRIVFLGDSLTWGGYGGNFVTEVARRLPHHEIINQGIGGNTVINLLRRLDTALALEPDGIFVMVGGNDVISYLYPGVRAYYKNAQGIARGIISPELFTQAYRELLTRIQLEQVLAWVGLPPTEYSHEMVETMTDYNALAQTAAHGLRVPVLDLFAEFAPLSPPDNPPVSMGSINVIGKRVRSGWHDYEAERRQGGYTYTFDGNHLMPEAAARMGALVADFLRPYLD